MTTINLFCPGCGASMPTGSLDSICPKCGDSNVSGYGNITPNSMKFTKFKDSGRFNLAVDAETVRKAVKGAGTRNTKLRSVLCYRTDHEIGKISQYYRQKYGRDMVKDVHYDTLNETDYRHLLKMLMMPKHYLNAKMLRWAVKGAGTHEGTLNDILVLSSNKDIILMKQAYDIMKGERLRKGNNKKKLKTKRGKGKHNIRYNYVWENEMMKKLFPEMFEGGRMDPNFDYDKKILSIKSMGNTEQAIIGDTSGDYQKTLLSLMEANRCEHNLINIGQTRQDAKDLYKAGEGRLGTNDSFFINILTKRSPEQIQEINKEYLNRSKKEHTLRKAIMNETSGNYKDILLGLTFSKISYRVRKIWKCIKGLGTQDKRLMYLIVSCPFEERTLLVKEYKYALDRDLVKDIKGDTSGEYQRTLLSLIDQE